jgi:ribulose-5-phosphate 4-epimerase/fuculose-1-phosphate aldolase
MAQALNRMCRLELLAQVIASAAAFDGFEKLGRPKELVAGHWSLVTGLGLPGQIPVTIDKEPETRKPETSNQQLAASDYFLRSVLRGLNPYGLGSWSQRTSGNDFDFICSADVISPLLHEPPAVWEYRLHQAIYRHQPGIKTIAIAYPPSLMAWSLLSRDFSPRTIPESYILLRDALTISLEEFCRETLDFIQPGYPPEEESCRNTLDFIRPGYPPENEPSANTADPAKPGTAERSPSPSSLLKTIGPTHPVALVQNGFFLCTGDNPFQVLDRLEVAENTAASLLLAKPLGPVNSMDDRVIQELKKKYLE